MRFQMNTISTGVDRKASKLLPTIVSHPKEAKVEIRKSHKMLPGIF